MESLPNTQDEKKLPEPHDMQLTQSFDKTQDKQSTGGKESDAAGQTSPPAPLGCERGYTFGDLIITIS